MQKEIKDYEEEWKLIMGYEEYYSISNYGRVRSLPRDRNGRNVTYTSKEKILKTPLSGRGYPSVLLRRPFTKPKRVLVHIMVAKHFIQNPDNKPQVNHIDGVKTNNYKHNLEWSTSKENINHAFDIGLNKKVERNDSKRSKPVMKLNVEGIELQEYPSASEAARQNNVAQSNINHAIKNKTHSNGYYWKYKN